MNNTRNYVISYRNPDTDGAACSIALAELLTISENQRYDPVLLGNINEETAFVLNYAGIDFAPVPFCAEDASSVVVVDTHHRSQLPDDFPFHKVRLVVDHHSGGDDHLFENALVDNRPIGAAASIVAEMYFDRGCLKKNMLTMLGFAILSNTLNFSAPSTSDFDAKMFQKITDLYPLPDKSVAAMFAKRAAVLQQGLHAALLSDFKKFETKRADVGISQLEIYDLQAHIAIHEIPSILRQIAEEQGLKYCMFNGVDLKTKTSIVICADPQTAALAGEIFHTDFPESGYGHTFDRILLRKTDFIPALNR